MSKQAAHQRRAPEPSRTLPAVLLLIAFAWPFVAAAVRIWYIPVYEADGVTIVDSFPIQEPVSFDFDVEHYDLDIFNVQELP